MIRVKEARFSGFDSLRSVCNLQALRVESAVHSSFEILMKETLVRGGVGTANHMETRTSTHRLTGMKAVMCRFLAECFTKGITIP